MTQPIFLVGARGCGKTTVGGALAAALGFHFVDTDRWLLDSTRMTVAETVAKEGWPGFRARESHALQSVTAQQTVVATGGGMVLADINRHYMRDQGIVLYLRAPATVLAGRLEAFPEEGQRPSLTGRPITDEIAEVLLLRDALYQQTAHHVLDASLPADRVVEAALGVLSVSVRGCLTG